MLLGTIFCVKMKPRMLNECLSTEVIRDHLGLAGEEAVFDIIQGIIHGDTVQATEAFREAVRRGNSVSGIFKNLVSVCCDITYALQSGTTKGIMHTEQYIQKVTTVSKTSSATEIMRIADGLSEVFTSSPNNNASFLMEMGILRLIAKEFSLSALEHKVTLLEEQITALRNGQAETVNEHAHNRAVISESQDMHMARTYDAPSNESGIMQDKSPYPVTEEFGTDLPGDSSSSERNDQPADSSILPYPQQLTEGRRLDDGSKITGSIDLFGTSGQFPNAQPATAYDEDIMDIGAFAGFARLR